MRFRFPFFFTPRIHTGLGYGLEGIGRACVNRTFNCITFVIVGAVLIYLFYKNPPWFQQLRENIGNFFRGL